MHSPSTPGLHLHVSIKTIEQHFTGALSFHLPWFQRAYAWSEEHATQLLRDLIDAADGARGRYFLGNVMLAVKGSQTAASIIDGHQRTLTLTILFALLRDRMADEAMRNRLDSLIRISERPAASEPAFRVSTQPISAGCFRSFVQDPGATAVEPEGNLADLLESERKFVQNRNAMALIIDEHLATDTARHRFADFLVRNCSLVIYIVDDEDEAWEMLQVAESTGLPFHSSERSKIALISVMKREVQEEAGSVWDIWQARLGADRMAQLLHHLRTLKIVKSSSKPVEQDVVELYALEDASLDFINDTLVPHAQRYLSIIRSTVGEGAERAGIARHLDTLKWLNREYWVPAALSWLEHFGAEHADTTEFFRRLDRLAWIMRVAGRDPVEQERRFRRVGADIRARVPLYQISSLDIEQRILSLASDNLLSRTFYDKTYSRLVLRRLSLIAGTDCGHIDGDLATVEHVLPRRPPTGSQWYTVFKNKGQVDQFAHRLGNLVVLTFWENQRAAARPFSEKRKIFESTRHVLARDLAKQPDWNPQQIEIRSEQLADQLFRDWGLVS